MSSLLNCSSCSRSKPAIDTPSSRQSQQRKAPVRQRRRAHINSGNEDLTHIGIVREEELDRKFPILVACSLCERHRSLTARTSAMPPHKPSEAQTMAQSYVQLLIGASVLDGACWHGHHSIAMHTLPCTRAPACDDSKHTLPHQRFSTKMANEAVAGWAPTRHESTPGTIAVWALVWAHKLHLPVVRNKSIKPKKTSKCV